MLSTAYKLQFPVCMLQCVGYFPWDFPATSINLLFVAVIVKLNLILFFANISCKDTFSVKKTWPSKVESYLEVNAQIHQQQEDPITECGQGLVY